MRALVAGGTGFIGRNIVNHLLSRRIKTKVLIRKESDISHLQDNGVELNVGNILEIDSFREFIKGVEIVFSAFGILGQWGVPDQTYWDVNTRGVKNLLEACLGSDVRQFIHVSSAGVLGPLPDGIIADESFPYNPSNIYEKTKCEAEKEILYYAESHRIPFTIIRPEFVYGPGDFHVLGLFKAINDRRFILFGNGKSLLHPTYIDDLIQGISLCIDNKNSIGKTYLITGDIPISVEALAMVISEELDVRLPKLKAPLFFASIFAKTLETIAKLAGFNPLLTTSRVKFFTENRAFSCKKAKEELGFVPRIDLREGVRRTINWYRENGYL